MNPTYWSWGWFGNVDLMADTAHAGRGTLMSLPR